MKRVLMLLLCLLLALSLVAMVACKGEDDQGSGDSSNSNGGNNSGGTQSGHVHTYDMEGEWQKDAAGHWFDATCTCDNVPVYKLNHTDKDNNNECDVCAYVIDSEHEHTYSEDWTVDCTNHWHVSDCGHTGVAASDLAAHADSDGDGECDTCHYVINDLHEHYYSSEWTSAEGYHWHAALCEHGVEVADKAACEVNAAGYCTVCDAKVRDIDTTSLAEILAAAVANNHKVTSGTVVAIQQAYEGSTVETGGTNEVFFILGNGDSFVKWGSYDKAGTFIGVDQYWFETISEEEIFGVQIPFYHPNAGTRNEQLEMFPVSGDADKLNGYTYFPGTILSAGYDDNTTLAQTLANLYDIMAQGINVSNAQSAYDAETGLYTFSYCFFFVNEVEGDTAQDDSGEAIISYTVEYFEVSAEFAVNADFVIDYADFTVKSYRNLTAVDEDLTYDPETNTIEFLPEADPTVYNYSVSQTSGERTYTSIYPKDSLMPAGFELYYVTEYENDGTVVVISEELIEGVLTLEPGKRVYLHIGSIVPASALASFMDMDAFEFTYVNKVSGETGQLWNPNGFFTSPTYSKYSSTIAFNTFEAGEYEVTIKFGRVEKVIDIVVEAEEIVVPPSTATTVYVQTTDTYNFDQDYFTYTAGAAGKYTFNLPAGLGIAKENVDVLVDFYDNASGTSVTIELAEGESIDLYVAATTKKLWTISVDYKSNEAGGGDDSGDTPVPPVPTVDITGVYDAASGNNRGKLTIDGVAGTIVFDYNNTYTFNYTFTINNGVVSLSNQYGPINESMAQYTGKLELGLDGMPETFWYNGYSFSLTPAQAGGDEDEKVTIDATYCAYEQGNAILSVAFSADGTVVFTFLNPMMASTITANYEISGDVVTLTDPETGAAIQTMAAAVTLTNGVPTSATYNGWDYELYAEGDAPEAEAPSVEISNGDNTVPVTGTDVMTNATLTTEGAGVYYITVGANAVVLENGWMTYLAGEVITVYADEAGEIYTFEVNSEDYTEGTVNLAVVFQPKAADEADKDALEGTYKIGDYTVELSREYGSGIYYATIANADYTVCLKFTYTVTDNGDNTYTLDLTYAPYEYEEGADQVDTLLALDWTISIDPVKELINNTYLTIGDYDVAIYKENGEYVISISYGWDTCFYFTYTVTDNGDGTLTLNQTYVENINECGDKDVHLAAMEALEITIEVSGSDLEGEGTYESPYVIPETGDYEASYAGDYMFPYFMYKVTADGYFTITIVGENPYFQYGTNIDNLTNNEGPDGAVSTYTFYVRAGQTVYLTIANGELDSAADVAFTVSFEEFVSDDASFLEGTWSGEQAGMFGSSTPYTFVIGADGTGTGSYTEMGNVTEFTIDFILVDGNNVTIYITTSGWFAQELSFSFTYNEDAVALENASMTLTKGTGDDGDDDEEPVTPPPATEPDGTQANPFIVGELPFTFTLSGKYSVFYKFVATEDATIVISYPSGGIISGLPTDYVKDSEARTYTFDVKVGDEIVFNPWTLTAATNHEYVIKKADQVVTPDPDPDEPGEEEGGEQSGNVEIYIGSGNGRGMKIEIDKTADTMVITRAASGSLDNFTGGTSYTFSYSGTLALAVNNVVSGTVKAADGANTAVMNLTFNDDGTVKSLQWNGATYENYVKQ